MNHEFCFKIQNDSSMIAFSFLLNQSKHEVELIIFATSAS